MAYKKLSGEKDNSGGKLPDLLDFADIQNTGDDAGVTFTGTDSKPLKNVVVGDRNNSVELTVGGDSTTVSMVVLQTNDDFTYVDRTDVFASDSGSTAPMFASKAAGETIYFGGDFKFGGIKAKLDAQEAVGLHENVVVEIWLGAPVNAWAPLNFMAVNGTFNPFSSENQRADNLATIPSISEQWHFDFDPWVQFGVDAEWELSTIDGKELYWGRMRLTDAITDSPVMQQFKLDRKSVV